MEHDHSLIEMLRYRRPEGSETQKQFCEKFLQPVFGEPDRHGNYIHTVAYPGGGLPVVCFTAHHDTVHRASGMQHVVVDKGMAYAPESNCLGADCTTGVWLILGMIKNSVPGTYVIHAGEEDGCVGSSALIQDYWANPESNYPWLSYTQAVISFDRKGTESIITHQMGFRTASDTFAVSLADVLGLPMRPDNTGSFTDSNEYKGVVGECTNISVGYYGQHTNKESQDIQFAYDLLKSLVEAHWWKLVFEREPAEDTRWSKWNDDYEYGWPTWRDEIRDRPTPTYKNASDILDLIDDDPEGVADALDEMGIEAEELYRVMSGLLYRRTV